MTALSERDLSALLERSAEEVEWHSFFTGLGKRDAYRGHTGARDYMRDLDEAWDFVRAEIDDGVAVGDVAVFVGNIHYRGKGSGLETQDQAGWMLSFRNRKLIRFRVRRPAAGQFRPGAGRPFLGIRNQKATGRPEAAPLSSVQLLVQAVS